MLIAKKPAKQGLNIIIVGCGKVGLTLIEQLVKEGHDITIIDQDAKKVQEVGSIYDVMGVAGNGASHRVQMDAGIASANLLIAVTESDELNLLVLHRGKSGCKLLHDCPRPHTGLQRRGKLSPGQAWTCHDHQSGAGGCQRDCKDPVSANRIRSQFFCPWTG